MTKLPPSPFSDSGVHFALALDEAAALSVPTPPGAAADIPDPSVTERRIEEAPASTPTVTVAAGDAGATNHIAEIFAGARKLEQIPGIFDQAAITPADELLYVTLKAMDDPYAADLIDIPDGMWLEFDPPPLFLQQAGA